MTEPGPTDPASVDPAKVVPRTRAEARALNRAEFRAKGGFAVSRRDLPSEEPIKPVGDGSASAPTPTEGVGAHARRPADPSTAEGRAALALEAIEILRAIMHAGPKASTNLDKISAARELAALAGWRRAAPSVKEEAIPFTSMLSRPSDGESKARTGVTQGGATPPATK